MEIYVLDTYLQVIGIIQAWQSLVWERKFWSVGGFTLTAHQDNYALLRRGVYLCTNKHNEVGIIYRTGISSTEKNSWVAGKFAENWLQERLNHLPTYPVLNSPFYWSHNLVEQNTTSYWRIGANEEAIANAIPKFEIEHEGWTIDGPKTDTRLIVETRGGTLWERCIDMLRPEGYSLGVAYKRKYKFDDDCLVVYLRSGQDRSIRSNNPTVFSDDRQTVITNSFEVINDEYRNRVFVLGEGEGVNRTGVWVKRYLDGEENTIQRDIDFDARDMQSENYSNQSEYLKALQLRGTQKAEDCIPYINLDATVPQDTELVYKKDYDVGDLCSYQIPKSNDYMNVRIHGITETYERGLKAPNISVDFSDINM